MTLGAAIAGGLGALRQWWRLALALYLAQAVVGMLTGFAVWMTFSALYGDRPVFDRGASGDALALMLSLKEHPGALAALVWSGVALGLGWALLSFYLTPGLLGVFAGRPFGEAARRGFWPFFRLALWSLVPTAIALAIVGLGVSGFRLIEMVSRWDGVAALVGTLPGLFLLALVLCAVDYARAELVVRDTTGSGRAFLRALRLVLVRPLPVVHYLVYTAAVVVLIGLYLVASKPLFGLLLFVARQLFLATRFALRVATSAGQVQIVARR